MRYLVLDDENIAGHYLAQLIWEVEPEAEVRVMTNAVRAMELVKENRFDVYFLDIQMPGIGGMDFAARLKAMYGRVNVIFVTGYSEHMGEAFRLDASDYIMKPATAEQVRHALANLRYEVGAPMAPTSSDSPGSTGSDTGEGTEPEAEACPLQITCFGNFEVYCQGKPLRFKFEKTKELFAYLVHRRGARCSNKEVMANLWEDDGHDSYFRMLKKDLYDTMSDIGCEDLLISSRGQIGLGDISRMDCDYFKWLEDPEEGARLYHGEYMAQYSWAEEMNGNIYYSIQR